MTELIEITKPLRIGHERTCKCSPNHINCLSAKEWIQGQVAIWEFFYEKRDIRDKNIHPAVFPIGLPKKCIQLFTHQGELVLDPFVGIGTTLVAAYDLNRNAVGFDLKREYADFSNKRIAQTKLDLWSEKPESSCLQIAICDEAHNIPEYFEADTVALAVTSPPYANLLNRPRLNKSIRGNLRQNEHYLKVQQYSADPRDLGTMEPRRYAQTIGEIYKGILPCLKIRAHSIINVTDIWWKDNKCGKRIPVHMYIIEEMEKAGYGLRNIIIWDRRNLVNKVGIFGWPSNYITLGTTFEFILDFWRPPQ
jgi:DNA modification methylase